ncbi:class F sortase [Nocardioides baekrokdamisoli]|uniref:Class F sortase n=1 Tax=Nocardioides baekrokdamisoli TaxID=1804624 RepID=A0A3G9IHG2_9ACTN|nr:class F sortase [Nocardioides baekrokdamisoli]BBH17766.1 class F sortase [Nocardioides baekrokdamisoli]
MRPVKRRVRATIAVSIGVALLVLAVSLSYDAYGGHGTPPRPAPMTSASAGQSLAASLGGPEPRLADATVEIPSLRIGAPLEPIGDVNGNVSVPGDAKVVGIYDGGSSLDIDTGTTVLVGHVTNGWIRGAFFTLATVTPGMTVYTRSAQGLQERWTVISVNAYPRDALPQSFFTVSGPRRLALVTCGGSISYHAGARSYADNIVVLATPVR